MRHSQFVLTNWAVTKVVERRKDSKLEVLHAVDVEANKQEWGQQRHKKD